MMNNINLNKKILSLFFFNVIGSNTAYYDQHPQQVMYTNQYQQPQYQQQQSGTKIIYHKNKTFDELSLTERTMLYQAFGKKLKESFDIWCFFLIFFTLNIATIIVNIRILYEMLHENSNMNDFENFFVEIFSFNKKQNNYLKQLVKKNLSKNNNYAKLQEKFPKLLTTNDPDQMFDQIDKLASQIVEYNLGLAIFNLLFAISISTQGFANTLIFNFYDIIKKNIFPLILIILSVLYGALRTPIIPPYIKLLDNNLVAFCLLAIINIKQGRDSKEEEQRLRARYNFLQNNQNLAMMAI